MPCSSDQIKLTGQHVVLQILPERNAGGSTMKCSAMKHTISTQSHFAAVFRDSPEVAMLLKPVLAPAFQCCFLPTRCAAVSVIISEVQPSAVPLYEGSSELLFKPVVHFFSELNRTQDGFPWPAHDVPKAMDHWWILDTPVKADRPYIWVPEDRLAEGWYNIGVGGWLAG
jgi:hypothetical protein